MLLALDLNISCIVKEKFQFVFLLPSLYEFSTVTCTSDKLECARRVGGHLVFWGTFGT